MKLRIIFSAFLALACLTAADRVAARLAREARQAQNSGQLVRAYLLFAEAAARDQRNPTYRANRDALAPIAKLLTKANVEKANISADIKAAENAPDQPASESAIEAGSDVELERAKTLQPLPRLKPNSSIHDFDLRGDEKLLFQEVASAYGIRVVWDPDLQSQTGLRFHIDHADFRAAMEALTAATGTFVFPIAEQAVFFARDTPLKRSQLEPSILLSVPLPDVVDPKDLAEAANAVRGALNLRAMAFDVGSRIVIVRDRVSRAYIARSLLEALLLPRAQVSIEVQLLTLDSDRSYHYGVSLPATFRLLDFGHIGALRTILPTIMNPMNFLGFGGGATLFGVGLTDATIFATYSKSFASNLYNASMIVGNGQTANLHVGDKFPIPQSLNTGFQQAGGSIYNPIGEVTLEDLGLVLKLTPHVNGEGDVGLDVEAEYKALGTQTIDTVPSINQRQFKGSVMLREGQWAVLAGIDENTHTVTRNGLVGVAQIPGLNQMLSENRRDDKGEHTLIVIKPTITRLPMSRLISPQYLLGPIGGSRVLL
ncbi:MAG: type II secretion system protein GspD [Bryobacteraceae bacterium]